MRSSPSRRDAAAASTSTCTTAARPAPQRSRRSPSAPRRSACAAGSRSATPSASACSTARLEPMLGLLHDNDIAVMTHAPAGGMPFPPIRLLAEHGVRSVHRLGRCARCLEPAQQRRHARARLPARLSQRLSRRRRTAARAAHGHQRGRTGAGRGASRRRGRRTGRSAAGRGRERGRGGRAASAAAARHEARQGRRARRPRPHRPGRADSPRDVRECPPSPQEGLRPAIRKARDEVQPPALMGCCRRLALVLAVIVLNFVLVHAAPGDPVETIAGASGGMSDERRRSCAPVLGLDQPLVGAARR